MIKNTSDLYNEMINHFPFNATIRQDQLLKSLSYFVLNNNEEGVFLLKGYAGTGKTTVISTLVNNLWKTGYKSVLMAPTGRAAKVLGLYSK